MSAMTPTPSIALTAPFGCALVGVVVALAIVDVREMILPDRLNLLLASTIG
jgi:hypothetical protein